MLWQGPFPPGACRAETSLRKKEEVPRFGSSVLFIFPLSSDDSVKCTVDQPEDTSCIACTHHLSPLSYLWVPHACRCTHACVHTHIPIHHPKQYPHSPIHTPHSCTHTIHTHTTIIPHHIFGAGILVQSLPHVKYVLFH